MTSVGRNRLITHQDKQARVYQQEVYPLLGQKLADLLTLGLTFPPSAHVLQIGCGLGSTTVDILARLDAQSRLVGVEATQPLVDRARTSVADDVGRRVFFRAEAPSNKLPFGDAAFDCTLANTALADLETPTALLAEAARVTKPGGTFRLGALVRGSWREFLDVFGDVLVRLGKGESRDAVRLYGDGFADPEALAKAMEAAGFEGVAVETTHWQLVFRSGREFFYAPVIESGPLARWKALAGKGPEMQDIFLAVKEAIDTYFGGSGFAVTLVGGVFAGTVPGPRG